MRFNGEVSTLKKAAFNDIHEGSVDRYNQTVLSKGFK